MATLADETLDLAFVRLYELHARDVYRYVLAVLRNPTDAEDVTQTTFMNAYRAFKSGVRPLKPQNWLIAIAHNACRTRAVRASRRPREVPLDDAVERLAVPDQDKPNVRELLRALEELPFNQRAALAMRELEGRTYAEIAETLGVTIPAVEALLARGRRSLRLKRTAVRGLLVVQLPRSLRTMIQHGGTATAGTTGAVAGGGALAKVAATVVAGLVAGGVGYKAVDAGILRSHSSSRHESRVHVVRAPAAPAHRVPAKHSAPSGASAGPAAPAHTVPARTASGPPPSDSAAAAPSAPAADQTSAPPAAPPAAASPSHVGPPGETQRLPVPAVHVPLPSVPATPPLPSKPPIEIQPVPSVPPVQIPPVQAPPAAQPPSAPELPPAATAPTPQLPQAPAPPALPQAPQVPAPPLP